MNGFGVSAAQAAAAYTILGAAMRGDTRPRQANGQLASRRNGFGSLARQYGMISKAPVAKVSKTGKQNARAQAKNRRAHWRAVAR
jgi:hypothetical protein